jgi:hypothetical protein
MQLWLIAVLRRAGYEPTMREWRIAMSILAAGLVVVVVALLLWAL